MASKQIVKAVRAATGGYQNVKAIALKIPDKQMVEISMSLTQASIKKMKSLGF